MSKSTAKQKGAAFGNLGDMMGMSGMSSVLSAVSDAGRPTFSIVHRSDIKLYEQQRNKDELETEEQTLEELGADMRVKGILQPIILCENEDGPERWRLVAGERRYHGSGIAEIDELPSMCYGKLTEQQIKDIQLAENIHRLNLSQLNEAKVLKQRLDEEFGGDVEALCANINKSRSWVSKRLGLLDIPEQTQRLIKEGITADIEVIQQLKTIEKIDPVAAKATVETLKTEKGQKGANARDTVKNAKDKVKPPKPKKNTPPSPVNPENVATPPDRSHEEHGPVTTVDLEGEQSAVYTFGDALVFDAETDDGNQYGADLPEVKTEEPEVTLDTSKVPALPPTDALAQAYTNIYEFGSDPKTVLSVMPAEQREGVENWLHSFYDAGANTPELARAILQGFRNQQFDTEGHGAFAMAAFLTGADSDAKFNLLDIMGSVKA